MQIHVTMEDIHEATSTVCDCPVARALTRHLGRQAFVSTTCFLTREDETHYRLYEMPTGVVQWIVRYDSRESMLLVPFSFTLDDEYEIGEGRL